MSGLLLERQLVGTSWCPGCEQLVVLGDIEPHTERPRRWVCTHGPDPAAHVWETAGPVELRPRWCVHVEVTDPHRPVTAPAPTDHTPNSGSHTGAATTTTAATTPPPTNGEAATGTAHAVGGPPPRRG